MLASLDKHSAEFNQQLFQFLDKSPTPFHATANLIDMFVQAGFQQLDESEAWDLEPGKYCVSRNDSSFIAFNLSNKDLGERGIRMLGAHTDSPCLQLKPNASLKSNGYLKLGVEVYGGALLNPWFDRDLSLAGRVSYRSHVGDIFSVLVNFEKPIGIIPSLAIHLDREANKKRSINPQTDILPIIQLEASDRADFDEILLAQINSQYPQSNAAQIIDHELSFYDTQGAAFVGLHDDFIASARLDNLLSCFVGAHAMLNSDFSEPSLLVCYDHEEVGSASTAGAGGNFLHSVLQRLCKDNEKMLRCIQRSLLISADNAHGIHPNYADRHDKNHGPVLNQGPVIKINANQRYASNSITSAVFQQLADSLGIPVQRFVVRTDMACGSTIGPISATEIGVPTVDIGIATFAMHSIRELAGSEDAFNLSQVLTQFFDADKVLINHYQ